MVSYMFIAHTPNISLRWNTHALRENKLNPEPQKQRSNRKNGLGNVAKSGDGRHEVQYVAQCVACAALSLNVWQ